MSLQPKLAAKPVTTVTAPTTAGEDIKKVSPEKVSKRIRNIIAWYDKKYTHAITAYFAAILSDLTPEIYEMTGHNMFKLFDNINSHVVVSNGRVLEILNYGKNERPTHSGYITIPIDAPAPITSADQLFRSIYAYPDDDNLRVKVGSLLSMREHVNTITFSDDMKAKMLEIVSSLQASNGESFPTHRVFDIVKMIKAVATIEGRATVAIEDMFVIAYLAPMPSLFESYVNESESIIVNYASLAQRFNDRLIQIRARFANAKNGLSNGGAINYMDPTIPASATLDDIIVETINETAMIEGEVSALLDGKNTTLNSVKPLVKVLDEAKNMKQLFARSKGMRA